MFVGRACGTSKKRSHARSHLISPQAPTSATCSDPADQTCASPSVPGSSRRRMASLHGWALSRASCTICCRRGSRRFTSIGRVASGTSSARPRREAPRRGAGAECRLHAGGPQASLAKAAVATATAVGARASDWSPSQHQRTDRTVRRRTSVNVVHRKVAERWYIRGGAAAESGA